VSLPLLISVPHAGSQVPPEVEHLNLLTKEKIAKDGDEGAHEIYDLQAEVAAFVTTDMARAFIDMNRPGEDRSSDGVVKTETVFQETIYRSPLQEKHIHQLITRYYHPYHRKISRLSERVLLGIDCHTMAAKAPPISDDAGTTRPLICLSNADGTCPEGWTGLMAECLEKAFGSTVSINNPFKGGHIIRSHACELPWLQLELSRTEIITLKEKRKKVLAAFQNWCKRIGGQIKGKNTDQSMQQRNSKNSGGTAK
jgi:N-formylglutamate amidohydrolase